MYTLREIFGYACDLLYNNMISSDLCLGQLARLL